MMAPNDTEKSEQGFAEAYGKLNAAQKKAVDAVEGPVMVIAGPGTGKTHILTLRIANILRVTHARPRGVLAPNILALTFTESAARTVGKRLALLIGEETARQVQIYTFHGFSEEILRRYPEAFPEYLDKRLMGEVEQVLLWRDVLENETVELLRTAKSPFHYLSDLKSLEDDMTRERITLDEYRAWLTGEKRRIEADESLRYLRDGKYGVAGEMKPEGHKQLERLSKGEEAIRLIESYRRLKDERGLYGYTDVLRIAVDGMASDSALRADLQEQYQYVLADEHQDANALQHALLDALAFDEHPNLFIVGDEKQAIFGFQGADSTHFRKFLDLYPRTQIITLTDNYRSYQGILDAAHTLLKDLPIPTGGEHAVLAASRGKGGKIGLLKAEDALQERESVASLVEEAIKDGVAPEEIAVITLKNKTADLFALHLRARGVPVLRAGNVDIGGRPSVRFLLSLMQAVGDPNDVASLRDALLAPWWKDSLAERAAFLRRFRDYELIEALQTTFPDIASTITELQAEGNAAPPLELFSKLLMVSGARAYFLSHGDRLEDIPLVRQLLMHIEDLVRRNPDTTFGEVVAALSLAREHGTGSIATSVTQREGHVTVITAHKAKGMEFERVFVTALTEREWNGRGRSALVPSPLSSTREFEEVVRLFYVALTRAKDVLTLSYPCATPDGREQAPLSLLPSGLPPVKADVEDLPVFHTVTDAPELVRELTLAYLTKDGLSPSAMSEYLASPPTFFAKRVLRLREPENRAIAIGNAVHAAVAVYLRTKGKSDEERAVIAHGELKRSLDRSLLPRNEAFDTLRKHARNCLDSYLKSPLLTREVVAVEEVYSVPRTVKGTELLLKGKADAVFKEDSGVCVVDFKTSSSLSGKKEEYERQLAFYDLLLRENGHNPTSALIVQIGEEGVTEHPIALTDEVRERFAAELSEVLNELLAGKWREGEPSKLYDDLLKLFA
ncbi:MAG: ATP-dependent helicase UvrD/PcrA [Candidatus Parcubacteria bacterium]|jgi:DNA helicase-2/ATP-dependent DNA helicase PcrA|nr:ATP-dependent helicase UvrD/PcrA [Candidatus Parcubacteria bacterium]